MLGWWWWWGFVTFGVAAEEDGGVERVGGIERGEGFLFDRWWHVGRCLGLKGRGRALWKYVRIVEEGEEGQVIEEYLPMYLYV